MTSDWGLAQVDRVVSMLPDIVLIELAMNNANWRRFAGSRCTFQATFGIGS